MRYVIETVAVRRGQQVVVPGGTKGLRVEGNFTPFCYVIALVPVADHEADQEHLRVHGDET